MNKLIIIAEDSLTQAEILKHMLEATGYEVAHALNGRKALDLTRERKPLMIISDILMPGMDGYDLCKSVKSDARLQDVPVILLSSLSDAIDVIKGLECGADSYLVKPVKERYLLSRINQVLDNRHPLSQYGPGNSLEINFAGRKFKIRSSLYQILNLLLSTYESALQRNLELAEHEKELLLMNRSLKEKVEERKKELKIQLDQKIMAEKQLKASEEKFRELVENSLIGIFISDLKGNILFANEALTSLLEYPSAGECMSANIRGLFKHAADYDLIFESLRSSAEVNEFETEFLLETGKTKSVILSANLENEELSGMVLDITDREQAVRRLRKYQGDLIHSREKAEQSEKLKSSFLANMSNDIITPVNTLVGFSELISKPGLSGQKLHEYTGQINESGNYLLNLIDNIIDIAKINSGEVQIQKSGCKINQLLLDLYGIYEREIRKKGDGKMDFFLRRAVKDNDLSILTEPYRLKKILGNLLDNAVKYTESGAVEFGYSIVDEDDPETGSLLQFFVRDTGSGISEEKLDLVFDRFRENEKPYTKPFDGAGLGLPVSKAYVELLGGRMWYHSEPDKGSEFYFTLPYRGAETAAPTEESAEIKDYPQDWSGIGILIAEDVESNFQLLNLILQKTGARVLWANNGEAAVQIYGENQESINVILMDIRMPVMSGYEAVAAIRKISKNVPVIAQTAYTETEDLRRIREADFNDYISKPFRREAMIRTIAKYIEE